MMAAAGSSRRGAGGAAALVLLALLGGAAAQAQKTLSGTARVVDGDTLWLNGKDKVRLYGVDAPEKAQMCKDAAGKEYACGAASTEALKAKIGTRPLSCTVKDIDQYGRNVAACSVRECAGPAASACKQEDVGAFMVSNGHATAYRAITKEYVAQEDKARVQKKGVWQGTFTKPNQWRKENKAAEAEGAGSPARPQQQQQRKQPARPQQQQAPPLNPRPNKPAASSVGAGSGDKPSYADALRG